MEDVTISFGQKGIGQQEDGCLNVTLFDQVIGLMCDVDNVL